VSHRAPAHTQMHGAMCSRLNSMGTFRKKLAV